MLGVQPASTQCLDSVRKTKTYFIESTVGLKGRTYLKEANGSSKIFMPKTDFRKITKAYITASETWQSYSNLTVCESIEVIVFF